LIHAHHREGSTDISAKIEGEGYFDPRSPWGERRLTVQQRPCTFANFNPRSPWGERLPRTGLLSIIRSFQSTLPVGGATRLRCEGNLHSLISIHAPRGGSDLEMALTLYEQRISIHAPRGGSDSPRKERAAFD